VKKEVAEVKNQCVRQAQELTTVKTDLHLTEHYFDKILPVKMISHSNRVAKATCTGTDQLRGIYDYLDLSLYVN